MNSAEMKRKGGFSVITPLNPMNRIHDTLYLEQSGSTWKVKMGEQTLDYSPEATANLEFEASTGGIRLLDDQGTLISKLTVPNIDALVQELKKLEVQQIRVEPESVVSFLKLMKYRSLTNEDIQMIVNELDHLAPVDQVRPREVTTQIQNLSLDRVLQLLPVVMRQMGLDYSMEKLGEPMTSLQHLLSKVDAVKDPEIAAFLAERGQSFSNIIPLLEELAMRTRVLIQQHPNEISAEALLKILSWLQTNPVRPAAGGSIPPALETALIKGNLYDLPNFSIFDIINDIEVQWIRQAIQKLEQNPMFKLEQIFLHNLNKQDI